MNKPDFSQVDVKKIVQANKSQTQSAGKLFRTNEGIDVKAIYTGQDIVNLGHVNDYPGLAPNTRGPYPTMYVARPWTVRQYAGFSTAEESNAFYRRNLAMGQKDYLLPSTLRLIVAMILIIHVSQVM